MPKKAKKTNNELYDSLTGFVERIIAETEGRFSEAEIIDIVGELLPNINSLIEERVQKRIGDIDSKISIIVLEHLGALAGFIKDRIEQQANAKKELKEGEDPYAKTFRL